MDAYLNRRAFGAGLSGLALVAAGSAQAQRDAAAPTAVTLQGRVRGFRRNGADIFLGLPYGASTAGSRRFLPPAPPSAWSGVRDATRLGQRAPQPGRPLYMDAQIGEYMAGGRAKELIALAEPMGEDCLVLNVLTPKVDKAGRAVMVYFHGGGFTAGSGAVHTLGDRFVAEEDVVLVTVNHRLSTFGFLYLGEMSPRYAQGNPGLLDLVAALGWVKANIAAFGGDPAKVTIFGESGGGAKVGYLMAMPQARGLFRAAVIQSASPSTPATAATGAETARSLMTRLGVGSDLDKLQALPMQAFLTAPPPPANGGSVPPGPGPVNDGQTLTGPAWPAATKISAGAPLLVGYCKDESTLFQGGADKSLFTVDWPSVPAKMAAFTHKPETAFGPALAAYRETYPQDTAPEICFRMLSIFGLGRGGRQIADMATTGAPVYYYRMEYDTGIAPGLRAFHTCELPLVNRMVAQPRAEGLSKQMAGAWAAFARTGGDPNHAGLPRWERYRSDGGPIMIFGDNTRCGPDPEARAQALLRQVLDA